jgi:hypothetical protein
VSSPFDVAFDRQFSEHDQFSCLANVPSMPVDMSPLVHQQAPPALVQVPSTFNHAEFQTATNISSAATSVHLETSNRLPPPGSTILVASAQESPMRVSLPVQMMPPGAQIIQVQSHPAGQPVQVVQRFAGKLSSTFAIDVRLIYGPILVVNIGRVFPNGQIIHQMPFGPVVTTGPPPTGMQLQHRPVDFQVRSNVCSLVGNRCRSCLCLGAQSACTRTG